MSDGRRRGRLAWGGVLHELGDDIDVEAGNAATVTRAAHTNHATLITPIKSGQSRCALISPRLLPAPPLSLMADRQFINRKATPIKRIDGEAFTRRDIQFDLLHFIFADDTQAFTDPWQDADKLTFANLYINTLLKSSKISKSLKDKMLESPIFSQDFAKLALLANVGRINSTQACSSTHSSTRSHSHSQRQSSPKCAQLSAHTTPFQRYSIQKAISKTHPA
jgi:hypothetical protein